MIPLAGLGCCAQIKTHRRSDNALIGLRLVSRPVAGRLECEENSNVSGTRLLVIVGWKSGDPGNDELVSGAALRDGGARRPPFVG